MTAKRRKTAPTKTVSAENHNPKLPFIEHLYELRKRLFYIVLSVGLWGALAYSVQQRLVTILLAPAKHQQFIYTSVGGGIDFLFRVCIYAGVALSLPVIVYQILRYLMPLIKRDAVRFITWASVVSGFLAVGGMLFGYFIGLPAALHFLLHQFTTSQIHPLLTIQSYMSFVAIYMFGSALLFQLPLVLVIINRIKPLKPKKLFRYERWVILGAFVGGALMNPSPRLQDQLLLSVPVIATYQLGIGMVWLLNRKTLRAPGVEDLLAHDARQRAERLARFQAAQAETAKALAAARTATSHSLPVTRPQPLAVQVANHTPALAAASPIAAVAPTPSQPPTSLSSVAAQPTAPKPSRPGRYVNDFTARRSAYYSRVGA